MAENASSAASPLEGCEPREPQLLQLRSDRRLGHEWDDWDGQPIPDNGVYREPPRLFLLLLAAWLGAVLAGVGAVAWIASPRLGELWAPLPALLGGALAAAALLAALWLIALGLAVRLARNPIPPRLAERGLLPRLMPLAERSGRWFGITRDRAGNAALAVYNRLASARARPGLKPDELLVLLPRCLDKNSMQSAMQLSGRYGVPMFVAARGRYAREMIARVKPRGVVAVACERDLVSGIHDVAARLPVLGTTLSLPDGPCKNTGMEVDSLERQIRSFLGLDAHTG
jgi:uncharacterized protein